MVRVPGRGATPGDRAAAQPAGGEAQERQGGGPGKWQRGWPGGATVPEDSKNSGQGPEDAGEPDPPPKECVPGHLDL